jgi:hypothetical protein
MAITQLPLETMDSLATERHLANEPAPNVTEEHVDLEPSFIERTLNPYAAKKCIYLKSAAHSFHSGSVMYGTRATFSIPDSCYIDSTGHFNAVELNICANQMYYVLWADIVRRKKMPEAVHWTEQHFKARQLPGMLIVRMESEFRKPIDAADFSAEGCITRVRFIGSGNKKTLFLRTQATFRDEHAGLARCEIDFALF